jgi:hypothetical protein
LPFLMLLLDYWPLGRLRSNVQSLTSKVEDKKALQSHRAWFDVRCFLDLVREKVPFFALTFFFTIVSSRVLAASSSSYVGPSSANLVANAFISYMRYLGKTFWPFGLSAFYPRLTSLSGLQIGGSIAAVILLSLIAFSLIRRCPYAFVGWFWFVGILVPVIGLPFGDHAMADRYAYVPLIGIFIALVWAAAELVNHWPRLGAVFIPLALVLLVTSGVISRNQLKYWRSSKDLLEHVLAVSGDNAMAHNNLAALLMVERDWPAAEKHLAEAVRLQPSFPAPRVNLARVLAQEGKPKEAAEELNYLNPAWKAEGHRQLAEVFLIEMKTNEATEQYTSAVQRPSV